MHEGLAQENILPEVLDELMSAFDDAPGCSIDVYTTVTVAVITVLPIVTDRSTKMGQVKAMMLDRPSAKAVKVLSNSALITSQCHICLMAPHCLRCYGYKITYKS